MYLVGLYTGCVYLSGSAPGLILQGVYTSLGQLLGIYYRVCIPLWVSSWAYITGCVYLSGTAPGHILQGVYTSLGQLLGLYTGCVYLSGSAPGHILQGVYTSLGQLVGFAEQTAEDDAEVAQKPLAVLEQLQCLGVCEV